ncbi:MAG TPA: regulatory protein RecX [Actinomycetes bacterium]
MAKAKDAALRLLEVRARSRGELEQRLARRGFDEEVVAAALDRLADAGLVDDAAFAVAYAESRSARGADARVIASELRDRGVASGLAEQVTDAVVPAEEQAERCRQVAVARLARLQDLAPEVRFRRLAGYLERRGYPAEVIATVLSDLFARRD